MILPPFFLFERRKVAKKCRWFTISLFSFCTPAQSPRRHALSVLENRPFGRRRPSPRLKEQLGRVCLALRCPRSLLTRACLCAGLIAGCRGSRQGTKEAPLRDFVLGRLPGSRMGFTQARTSRMRSMNSDIKEFIRDGSGMCKDTYKQTPDFSCLTPGGRLCYTV